MLFRSVGMIFIKNYWEFTVKDVHYPEFFMQIVLPIYISIWLLSAYLGGGYDQPIRISRIIRGLLTGTVVILVIYALLPENYRFSRALILLGTACASLSITLLRVALHFSKMSGFQLELKLVRNDNSQATRHKLLGLQQSQLITHE